MSPSDVAQIELNGDQTNAFLVGRVLVDAGTKSWSAKVLRAVAGREIVAHLVTHAHPDHAGGSRRVAAELGVPVWAGAADAASVEAGEAQVPGALLRRVGRSPGVPVARRLREGDEVDAGFVVLETPGHTPGHVALWREEDRTLLAVDAIFNMNPITRRRGLRPPPRMLSVDMEQARASIRRLAALEPRVVYFGHGAPLRDPAALAVFAASV